MFTATTLSDHTHQQKRKDFYPSKLFSLGDYYLPRDIKDIFAYCRYLVLTDPIVSGAIHRLAESPITDIVYEHGEDSVKDKYRSLFEGPLQIRERLLEAIFDLITYSNAFLSFQVPVTRYLINPNLHPDMEGDIQAVNENGMAPLSFDLKYREQLGRDGRSGIGRRFRADTLQWEITGDGQFKGRCPITQKEVIFKRQDRYYASSQNVSIKRWDPNEITIQHNPVTGSNWYYHNLDEPTRQLILNSDRRHYIEDPWEYIEAARQRRNVKIKNEHLYHLSNVRVSGAFNGWGVPRLLSAFKLIFYYMTLLRANEATAAGRINDLTILFPQTQSGMTDPARAIPGASFKAEVARMVKNHSMDKSYVGVSGIPVGSVSVFGEGRMQLVSSELEPVSRMICVALGLPYDHLFGGGAYTGQAVGARTFAAQTGLSRERFNELLSWFVKKTSNALGEDNYSPDLRMTLKEAEGPDDVRRKELRVNLALSNKMSLRTAMEDLGADADQEFSNMEDEAKILNRISMTQQTGAARSQARAEEIVQRSQMKMQEEIQEQQALAQHQSIMAQPEQVMGPADPMAPEQPQQVMTEGVNEMAPPIEEGQPQGDKAHELAEVYLSYIDAYPERQDDILMYAQQQSPEAYQILLQHLGMAGDIPNMDSPSAQLPDSNFQGPQGAAAFSGPSSGGGSSGPPEQLPSRNQ